ncbi:MAG: IS256 family transposase, partial [Candidatus Brocadiaceae bacterium]|nr:IS256 family transposase [Candidatus Brocadiaceae bacterium]
MSTSLDSVDGAKPKGIVSIDDGLVKEHLNETVRKTVEQTLNAMLDAEAEELCNAPRYGRTEDRRDYRSGHYTRDLDTKAGKVKLKMPKLRTLPFETQIIERYRRRESSVEEALIEMYLAGVSVRRVEDITEALWGTKVSPSTLSELNKKVYVNIEKWLASPIEGEHPYVYLDGMYLKRSWGGEVRNVSVLIAVGVNRDGYREVLGVREGLKEDKESWLSFLRHLKERGLTGTRLFISDKCLGLIESLCETFPDARWQRCTFHFHRNVLSVVPKGKAKEVGAMLRAVHAQEDLEQSRKKAKYVAGKLREMKLHKAAETFENGVEETLTYYHFPREHKLHIYTNNMLER